MKSLSSSKDPGTLLLSPPASRGSTSPVSNHEQDEASLLLLQDDSMVQEDAKLKPIKVSKCPIIDKLSHCLTTFSMVSD